MARGSARGVLACALALAGCSSHAAPAPAAAPPPIDGQQNYASLHEFAQAVDAAGVPCTAKALPAATTSGGQLTCGPAGRRIVLQLWANSADRDSGVGRLMDQAASEKRGYCYVLGLGSDGAGAWSIDATAAPVACLKLGHALQGSITDVEP